jgi:hypothetical protein
MTHPRCSSGYSILAVLLLLLTLISVIILSWVYDCVTNNNGSWLDLLTPSFINSRNHKSQYLTINLLPRTRYILILTLRLTILSVVLGCTLYHNNSPTSSELPIPIFYPIAKVKVKVKVTLRLAVYRQSVRLGVKPLETHDQIFFFFFGW